MFIASDYEGKKQYFIELVHYNKRTDLSIFRIKVTPKNIPALEISDVAPEVGSEVTVVGNPNMMQDVVTSGTVAKIEDIFYIMTNKVYGGNSGGAVIYKGKIVGVLSAIYVCHNFPVVQDYSIAIRLREIHRFLEDSNIGFRKKVA